MEDSFQIFSVYIHNENRYISIQPDFSFSIDKGTVLGKSRTENCLGYKVVRYLERVWATR